MREHAVPKYRVYNPENNNCSVCVGINRLYKTESFQQELEIPETIGKGYCRRIIVRPSLEIFMTNGTLYEKMIMRSRQNHPQNWLVFCMGDPIQWLVEEKKQEYVVTGGENYIINGSQDNHLCTYNPGRFLGLSIQVGAEFITSLTQHMGREHTRTVVFPGHGSNYNRKISPAIRLILNQIMNCRYREQVKKIYLEGKILELIAVYLDETIFENGALRARTRLSTADIQSLHEAKRLLDKNLISPPTLGQLAKLVCLNEFKLKSGFKELFGLPVHAYVIDQRMELVLRFLMEDRKLKVSEAILRAGYNDASHFAEKFREKYGINPSDVRKGRKI